MTRKRSEGAEDFIPNAHLYRVITAICGMLGAAFFVQVQTAVERVNRLEPRVERLEKDFQDIKPKYTEIYGRTDTKNTNR